MARTSRVSSGSTSRVPLGIGWIITTPRLRVNGLCGHPLDAGAQLAQALVDALVPAVDLTDVADLATSIRAQRREQHGHAGADVRRLQALSAQPSRARHECRRRVAH